MEREGEGSKWGVDLGLRRFLGGERGDGKDRHTVAVTKTIEPTSIAAAETKPSVLYPSRQSKTIGLSSSINTPLSTRTIAPPSSSLSTHEKPRIYPTSLDRSGNSLPPPATWHLRLWTNRRVGCAQVDLPECVGIYDSEVV